MLLGVPQQCLLGAMLFAPGVYTQPEAPYPDTAGWLPLVYEHTADGYDNHDEHYANKGECLPGSTVQLRGHVQCVSGNQEWCVQFAVHSLRTFQRFSAVSAGARSSLLTPTSWVLGRVHARADSERNFGSWKAAAASQGFATVPPACRPGGTVESTPAKIDGSASGYTLDGPTIPIVIDSEGKMKLSSPAGDHWCDDTYPI